MPREKTKVHINHWTFPVELECRHVMLTTGGIITGRTFLCFINGRADVAPAGSPCEQTGTPSGYKPELCRFGMG